jgi:lincosamide and streptogramin A transport system ATP-binding/permease protein
VLLLANIELQHVSFGYGNQLTPLFEDVNLSLDEHWKLGLIGRNGRGKTTLMKMLLRELTHQGTISHTQDFVYFPQTIKDDSLLTYYVLQDLANYEDWELERELNLLKVDLDVLWRPFSTLSGGEQTKVLLSLLFLDDKNFPLIDEPTNHLDLKGRKLVADYLKKKKQGLIVSSHDRAFIDEVVDHVLSIEKSQLVLYQGNFSVYEEEKKLRDQYELKQNEKRQSEISRLKKTAREKEQWSKSREKDKYGDPRKKGSGATPNTGFIGARAARMMSKRKNMEKRMQREITEKEKLLKNLEFIEPLKMNYVPNYHTRLLHVEDFALGFEGKKLFQPLSFELHKGEKVALIGPNGIGKSMIINFLRGDFSGDVEGVAKLIPELKISYVRQKYDDNKGSLQKFAEDKNLDYQTFLSNLKKLGMEREVFQNKIEEMSMGQQKKVELAKSLSKEAELYIWDEPLNFLDVFNHKQLEQLITEVKPSMLLVEHDEKFLQKIQARIIKIS